MKSKRIIFYIIINIAALPIIKELQYLISFFIEKDNPASVEYFEGLAIVPYYTIPFWIGFLIIGIVFYRKLKLPEWINVVTIILIHLSALFGGTYLRNNPPYPISEITANQTDTTSRIFIASIPPVADIYFDDSLIGKTNIAEIIVKTGKHQMRFENDSLFLDTLMNFNNGKNPSVAIRLKNYKNR